MHKKKMEATSSISKLGASAVHRICSGQVVTDLRTAVKELVENALDAGATSVEIVLVDDGVTSIEVKDNGSGIAAADFATTCRKHCTSKLASFGDLARVDSFGFRGEALSSLCALALSVTITTRHVDAKAGAAVTYNRAGAVATQTVVGRPVGTTVEICGLFKPLPVRHRQFKQKIASQFARLLATLQAYAVVHTGVRISCRNRKKGRTTTCLQTQSSTRMEENIAAVFSSKFLSGLVRVDIEVPLDTGDLAAAAAVATEEAKEKEATDGSSSSSSSSSSSGGGASASDSATAAPAAAVARIEGLVSKAGGGIGRQNNARQFMYINQRPVDVVPLTQAIDSAWRKFEMKQKPAFFLQLHLPPSLFDVNITPDKRKVLLSPTIQESALDALRDALVDLWSPTLESKTFTTASIDSFLPPVPSAPSASSTAAAAAAAAGRAALPPMEAQRAAVVAAAPPAAAADAATAATAVEGASDAVGGSPPRSPIPRFSAEALGAEHAAAPEAAALSRKRSSPSLGGGGDDAAVSAATAAITAGAAISPAAKRQRLSPKRSAKRAARNASAAVLSRAAEARRRSSASTIYPVVTTLAYDARSVRAQWLHRKRTQAAQRDEQRELEATGAASGAAGATPAECSAFAADIDQADATSALEKTFEKTWFTEMEVIGQFNLGFIIARHRNAARGHDDLWILDQHACDEKFRYETLQRSTTLHKQRLFCPLQLDVTASEEAIIKSHLAVFAHNGFEIAVDESRPLGAQLTVSQVPFSKGVTFGTNDIQELASLIEAQGGSRRRGRGGGGSSGEWDGGIPRLPKLHTIFASRACRSAIMVGTALTHRKQQDVLGHLTGLHNPWCCPHGRPTMRHLVDLCSLRASETKAAARAAAAAAGTVMMEAV